MACPGSRRLHAIVLGVVINLRPLIWRAWYLIRDGIVVLIQDLASPVLPCLTTGVGATTFVHFLIGLGLFPTSSQGRSVFLTHHKMSGSGRPGVSQDLQSVHGTRGMHTTLPLSAQLRLEEGSLTFTSMWDDMFLRIIGRLRPWKTSGCLKIKVGPIIRVFVIHVPVMHPALLLRVYGAAHALLDSTGGCQARVEFEILRKRCFHI